MGDRFLVWASAGILTAGLSAATIVGAGAAIADDGAAAGGSEKGSSQSMGTPGTADSDKAGDGVGPGDGAGADGQKPDDKQDGHDDSGEDADRPRKNDRRDRIALADEHNERPPSGLAADDGEDSDEPAKSRSVVADTSAVEPDLELVREDRTVALTPEQHASTETVQAPKKNDDVVDTIVGTVSSVVSALLSPFASNGTTPDIPGTQPQMWTLAAASRREFENAFESPTLAEDIARPSLYNLVGSFLFNAFQAFETAFVGAPQVPPGSTVRVQRSTLNIDCGPGYTVDADWYFPDTSETGPPPTRLIYFQHGFPGSSAEYDYTAAELAERNQAIVVAPTISGNLFDCYGCQLGGDPMHAAVGKLFVGDRDALLASARAAGFDGDTLPERFVIAGHSGGGQLAGGAAGYFEEFAPDEQDHNLVGVLLLDTSPIGGAIERGLDKIPDDIPVYTIAAAPSFLNSQGGVERLLTEKRPGQFVGVELVGGTHADVFQSHNPIIQISGWIAGMGIPRSGNIEAAQVLAQGWIDDWYDGTDTGVYGDLGSTIDIPDTGGAQAYVLPAPAHQWSIVDLIVDLGLQSVQFITYQPCAVDPSAKAAASSCSAAAQTAI